jgi:AcrR family transcriptional regulator
MPTRVLQAGPRKPAGATKTPLAVVLAALRRAEARGELTSGEMEWSAARLTGRIRRGNPRLEGVDRRESILSASAVVFRRRGYNRSTIEEIAAELLLTKAGVYHYFSSKREILEHLCDHAMKAAEEAVEGAQAAGGRPAQQLSRMLGDYARALMEEPAFTVLMRHLEEVGEASLADLQGRRKVIESRFQNVLENGVREGMFEVADSRIAVFGMIGAINWIYAWYEEEGRLPAAEVRGALVSLAMNGILARPFLAVREE